MNLGSRIITGVMVCAAFACGDRDAELGQQYRAAAAALVDQRVPGSKKVVQGRDGWLLHWGELKYLNAGSLIGEHATQANVNAPPEYADPVPAIVDFDRQLQERGITMYFMPVPVRPAIFPESVLGPEPLAGRRVIPNLDLATQELLSALEENGVRVVDVTPVFLKHRESREHGAVFYSSEGHWTPYGMSLAVRMLAPEIKKKSWYEAVPKHEYHERWFTRPHRGSLNKEYEMATGTAPEKDQIPVRKIRLKTPEGTEDLELQNPESPVIVMGDSNTVFWGKWGSALPHHLAFELGFPVDVLSTTGGGANQTRLNLARRIQAEPEYLDGKRVVIWCFSARAFTNTREGWLPIPL
jgi:alginate O-acetyltransferase complex protein AlgJ